MMLTGKCKQEFEEWYLSQDYSKQGQYEYGQRKALNMFNAMMLPFKWGVYVDFFDSIGIDIDEIYNGEYYLIAINYQNEINHRPEARIEAIKNANEIYNAK